MPTAKTNTTPPKKAKTATSPTSSHITKKLTKSSHDKVLFGVCGGLAEYLMIDAVIIRILFVILAVTGSGVIIYLALALILPEETSVAKSAKEVVEENGKSMEEKIEQMAANVEEIAKKRNTQTWIGVLVIILGAMLLMNNLGFFDFGRIIRLFFESLWPLFVIAVGLLILTRSKNDR